MSRIPFIHAAFPDPAFSKPAIEKRLNRHFRRFAARKAGLEAPLPDDDAGDRAMKEGITEGIDIPWRTAHRIPRRADAISACASRNRR